MNAAMKITTKLITLPEETRSETLKYFELSDTDLNRTCEPGRPCSTIASAAC
jgi:hypothetical protein